jgi:DNA-binding MarR family transcriptional regulator
MGRAPAAQRIADLLITDGLARYELNPQHRGSPLARLTDIGQNALATTTAASLAWRRAAAADIPDEHIAIACEVLRTLTRRSREAEAADKR